MTYVTAQTLVVIVALGVLWTINAPRGERWISMLITVVGCLLAVAIERWS